MPSVEWNRRTWDQEHSWSEAGDEWNGMAEHCHQPYEAWKQTLIETFLFPYVTSRTDALEVAPGYGRWTEHLVDRAASVTMVDLSPTCIEVCRDRFGSSPALTYIVNDGTSLPGVEDASVDFVWSFDSFVHMELPIIGAYVEEFSRVLRPGGHVVLHHAGKRLAPRALATVTSRLGQPGRVAQRMITQRRLHDSGRRADVTASDVAGLMRASGFKVVRQTNAWGDHGQYDVDKYRDIITVAIRATN
jgi:ubiquinone/menaquinone biosynthesis C-methylase UbiE